MSLDSVTNGPVRFRRLQFALLLGLLGTPLTAGCGSNVSSGEPTPNKPRIETVSIRSQHLVQSIEISGTVEGYETAELYAKVGGYLKEMLVDIGDPIEKGQQLATIDVPEMAQQLVQKRAEVARAEAGVEQARAAVRQTEAEVASARAKIDEAKSQRSESGAQWRFRQAEYRRIQGLVESGALLSGRLDEVKFQLDAAEAALGAVEARIRTAEANFSVAGSDVEKAKADLAGARAQVEVAKADREIVRTMLQYATIRAPFDGVVTRRWVHRGAFIQPATRNSAAGPLLTVTRTDRVRVLLDLPMAEVRLLNRGDPAVLGRIAALPGEQFEGRVTRFSPSLDVASRMMRVEIDLENPGRRLLPGYYGYVTLLLEEYPATPVVPSSALMADGATMFVYVVQDGVCRKRTVEVNYQDGVIAGIASGLNRGEQVVRSGGGQLTDGQAVAAVLHVPEETSG